MNEKQLSKFITALLLGTGCVFLLFMRLSSAVVLADDAVLDPLTIYALQSLTTTNSQMTLPSPPPPDEFFNPISVNTVQSAPLIRLDDFRTDGRFSNIDGSNTAVVIVDTGIDLDHSFFGPDSNFDSVADRIVYQYDFADGDADATDINGHGSNVSSIVASSDGTYTGMAPDADIIHLKVFKNSGSGSFAYVEAALQWVVANAVSYNIVSVNLSLGDTLNHASEQSLYGIDDELAALNLLGVTIIASAGNDFFPHSSVQGVGYPAADANTVAVGAVFDSNIGDVSYGNGAISFSTGADEITSFSQRHATLSRIFAPGAAIIGAGPTGGLTSMHGTSQSAPHVAGIVALMQELALQELGRKLTASEVESLMESTAVSINDGDDEDDNVTNTSVNYARIDVFALGEAILAMGLVEPSTVDQLNTNSDTGDGVLSLNEATNAAVAEFLVTFSKSVVDPAGHSNNEDVTNPANYRLILAGANGTLETAVCGAPQGDDALIVVDAVTYDNGALKATVQVNGGAPLIEGTYRFLVCHTIEDSDGNQLDGDNNGSGGDDYHIDFEIDTTAISGPDIDFNGLEGATITTSINAITVVFPDDMRYTPPSYISQSERQSQLALNGVVSGEVTNPLNYQLYRAGENGVLDSSLCHSLQGDDSQISVDNVLYEPNTKTATLSLNSGNSLENDTYGFVICGTIEDSAGNASGSDYGVSFIVKISKIFLPLIVK